MVRKTRRIVERYIFYKIESVLGDALKQQQSNLSAIFNSDDNSSPVHLAMQNAANNYEIRYKEAFPDLMEQMRTTNTTTEDIKGLFTKISVELFQLNRKELQSATASDDLVKWGHVVALFVFAGVLAVRAVELNCLHQVDSIITWVTDFLDHELCFWLETHGGWEKFVEWTALLEKPHNEELHNTPSTVSQGIRSLMSVGVLAACVGLGAIFMSHK